MKVPFLDLRAHHEPLRLEIMEAIGKVVDASAFAGGPFVTKFEDDYARFCRTRFAVGVGHGTDALWLSLLALGVGPGDEVICPTMTFMATAEAISLCGATPVFVDIDPVTYTIDVSKLTAAVTQRTKAIVPVHLFGQCADMDPVLALAARDGITVLEDAAQSQGALYKGRSSGSLGRIAATSFYPGKNIGAWGEAGAVTTNDATLCEAIKILREHGQRRKYVHERVGWNGRMDGIQAAVLGVKLGHLQRANDARRRAAALYHRYLGDLPGVTLPTEAGYARHVFHIYAVQVEHRDRVIERMNQAGVTCGIHYPVPVHLQPAYAHLGHRRGDFPVSETCADRFLSLPIFPEITEEQIGYVCGRLEDALAAG
jgi:dTDP-4-amino-4,6-dideoxygalactose transaminase